jgi:hypothetical protein
MVLQTQLRCTYGFAYICLDILYPKCLIASLINVDSFTSIVGLCLLLKIQNELQRVFFSLLIIKHLISM